MTPVFTIPLKPLAAQTVSVQLANQPVRLTVYQKRTGLYIDIYLNDQAIVTGALALDRVAIVREAYRPFAGDFAFVDTMGASDPAYDGLGSRYQLVWGI